MNSDEQNVVNLVSNIIEENPGLWSTAFLNQLRYFFESDEVDLSNYAAEEFIDSIKSIRDIYEDESKIYNVTFVLDLPADTKDKMKQEWLDLGEALEFPTGVDTAFDVPDNPYIADRRLNKVFLFDRAPAPTTITKILDPRGVTENGTEVRYVIKTDASAVSMEDGSSVEEKFSSGVLQVKHGGTGVDNLDDLKSLLGINKIYSLLGTAVSKTLDDNSWEVISKVSDADLGANFWSVGDTKSVHVKGTVGTLEIDETLWVYILGFNHNSDIEGNGITFGGFKTAQTGGKDVCIVDANYNKNSFTGALWFNLNHWGTDSSPYNTNYGGWKGCDARYDILGSTNQKPDGYGSTPTTDRVGYDAPTNTATSPVANTLMAALPSDLRTVMKPITKYTDNKGNSSSILENITTSVDYLPLLSEFEIFGERSYANQFEQNYQKQYAYFVAGNSKVKYRHSSNSSTAFWWERSPDANGVGYFCSVGASGSTSHGISHYSSGLAPAFMV